VPRPEAPPDKWSYCDLKCATGWKLSAFRFTISCCTLCGKADISSHTVCVVDYPLTLLMMSRPMPPRQVAKAQNHQYDFGRGFQSFDTIHAAKARKSVPQTNAQTPARRGIAYSTTRTIEIAPLSRRGCREARVSIIDLEGVRFIEQDCIAAPSIVTVAVRDPAKRCTNEREQCFTCRHDFLTAIRRVSIAGKTFALILKMPMRKRVSGSRASIPSA
jgi:hypothetical protein